MEFDEVFQYIGDIGLYQILLYFSLGILNFFNGLQGMLPNFFYPRLDSWCRIPRLQNFSFDTQRLVAIPYQDGNPEEYDACKMFDLNYDNLTNDDILTWDRVAMGNMSTIDCPAGYVYDQSEFVSTITSKFDLVCGRSWMAELTSTIYMVGILVGSLASGVISDRFGRKIPLMVATLGYLIFALLQGFAPNYAAFVIFRFLNSVCNMTSWLCTFTLMMEIMGPSVYVMLGTLCQNFFSVGIMAAAGLAYFIRDERNLFIAGSVPLVCTFPFIWLIPESPRWLVSKGRYKEAEKTLKYIAKVNRREFPNEITWTKGEKEQAAEEIEPGKCSDICKSSILCAELALVYFNWFSVSLVYYGVSFNAGSFGDVFLNTFLSGVIELPANTLCWIALERGGRRWPNGGSLLLTGLFCLACVPVILIRPDMSTVLTVLSTIGKGTITFAFTSIYLYSAELFPTPVRQLALGSASMFGRFGSMASPYLGRTLEDVWAPMPSVIFGVLAAFTGGMVFFLPETKGKPLPDTIEDAENNARRKKVKKPESMMAVEASDNLEKPKVPMTEISTGESNGYTNLTFVGDNSDQWQTKEDADEPYTRL